MSHTSRVGAIALLALSVGSSATGCSGGSESGPATGSGGGNGASSGGGAATTGGTSQGGSSGSSSTGGGGAVGSTGTGGSGAGGSGGAAMCGADSSAVAPPAAFKCSGSPPNAPAPAAQWVNATGNLANMASECGNLTMVSADPCTSRVIAGVAKAGLWATTDGGKTWTKLGAGAGSAVITNRPLSIVYDPEHQDVFWESGIYNGGGVYKTTDNGQTFQQLGTISHTDLVSVDFTDPERKTLLVGGHEQKQTLYLSTDGGKSFNPIGKNLPADSHFSSAPVVLDAKNFLLGSCGWGDGTCGVYRSTDGGTCWTRASDQPAVARPLWAKDGTLYWSLVWDGGIATSSDEGKTWAKAADGISSAYPVELPDGRVASLANGHLAVSKDKGKTWTQLGANPPFKPSGATYSAWTKTFYVWQNDCNGVVLPNAIASMGFDYTTQ